MQRHLPASRLFVLALDSFVYEDLGERRVDVVVQAPEGLKKQDQTYQEWCWSLASWWTWEVMQTWQPSHLAYIDADMFLFGDLAPLYAEVGDSDVAVVPHRWSPPHEERLKPNGTYNVSWVYFKNSFTGRACLKEWSEKCREWCYYRIEQDKFADQGYLENWPERWGAHVVKHLGVGLAPWNQEQYAYEYDGERLFVVQGEPSVDYGVRNIQRIDPVLLYHFHGWNNNRQRAGYSLHNAVAEHLYRPYEKELERVAKETR